MRPLKYLISPRYRSEIQTAKKHPDLLIQESTATRLNRYPVLFSIVEKALSDIEQASILSYGCSTGEEAASLKALLPKARITGVDLNKRALKIARKNYGAELIQFCHVGDHGWQKTQSYDAILALAVFQKMQNRREMRSRSHALFPFDKFRSQMELLHPLLKPGGIMVIDHSDYRFSDLEIADEYQVSTMDKPVSRQRNFFDPNEIRMETAIEYHRVFIKSPPAVS